MPRTVTWNILRDLAAFRAQKSCAISLYLDLAPSDTLTASDLMTRVNAQLDTASRGFDGKDSLSHDEKVALRSDVDRILEFFQSDFDRDGSRGFALFVAGRDNAWSQLPLTEPVQDAARIGRCFHVAPLVPFVGAGDGVIVAVVSRERGNLYRLAEGRLVDLEDLSEEQPGRHDQGGLSQSRYQRHIDTLATHHVQAVAEEFGRRLKSTKGARAVVVATEETRPEFEAALDREALESVIGWTHAESHATASDLLETVTPFVAQWRSQQEDELVERWLEEHGRKARASAGWEQTLEAASDARVEVLLYADRVRRQAWQCPKCSRVAASPGSCPLDGTRMEESDDGLDLAAHQTLTHGGTLCALRHRTDLDQVEGIGALLRF